MLCQVVLSATGVLTHADLGQDAYRASNSLSVFCRNSVIAWHLA